MGSSDGPLTEREIEAVCELADLAASAIHWFRDGKP